MKDAENKKMIQSPRKKGKQSTWEQLEQNSGEESHRNVRGESEESGRKVRGEERKGDEMR